MLITLEQTTTARTVAHERRIPRHSDTILDRVANVLLNTYHHNGTMAAGALAGTDCHGGKNSSRSEQTEHGLTKQRKSSSIVSNVQCFPRVCFDNAFRNAFWLAAFWTRHIHHLKFGTHQIVFEIKINHAPPALATSVAVTPLKVCKKVGTCNPWRTLFCNCLYRSTTRAHTSSKKRDQSQKKARLSQPVDKKISA